MLWGKGMSRSTVALLVAFAAVGCTRTAPQPGANAAAAAAAQGAPGVGAGNPSEVRTPGKGASEAGLEARIPLVYVDGEPRGALAYNELPAALPLDGQHRARLCDYFKLLGADCAKVQRVDFHVGDKTTFVSAAELKKQRRATFHFTDGLAGKPAIDAAFLDGAVDDVMIWLDQIPGGMVRDDGRRGVRVNVDGRLVAKIKRNLLEGNVEPVVEPRPGDVSRYRLRDFLASRSVALPRVRGIDLVTRDEKVVRVPADAVAAGVEFIAPDKGHGEMTFLFGGRAVKALAVDVWAESEPPTRPMREAGELHASLGAP